MQSALNVDKNVKFRSNLILADLYIAENVMLNEDRREEIDIKLISERENLFSLFNLLFHILFLTLFHMHMCKSMKSNYKSCM